MKTEIAAIYISDRWERLFQLLVLSMLIMSTTMLFGESSAELAWTPLCRGADSNRVCDVEEIAANGYTVIRYTNSFGDVGNSVIEQSNHGYIIASYTCSVTGNGESAICLAKADGLDWLLTHTYVGYLVSGIWLVDKAIIKGKRYGEKV